MFGNTPFGGFGSNNAGSSLFGQSTTAQPQQQQAAPSLFGGGTTAAPTFGGVAQQTLPAFGFGSTTTPTQSPGLFGQQQTQQPTTGGFFGGTPSLFSAAQPQQPGGTTTRFVSPTGQEAVMKNGVTTTVNTRHQAITAMKEYENKSFEELRVEDYQANRKGPQATTTTGLFGATAAQPQTSLFGTNTSTTGTGSPFGLFGQSTPTATSTTTNLFGSQPKPGGIFGSGTTTTPAVAAPPFGTTTTTGFQFNPNPTSQPQSVFGTNNATPTTSTGFSFTSQPAATFWGQKPATPTATTTTPAQPFGSTGLFANAAAATVSNLTAPNKPLFGSGSLFGTTNTTAASTLPSFGTATTTTPSIFTTNASAQQPAKPFGFSLFPSTTPTTAATTTATQPLFGTNPLMSTPTTAAAAPATNMFGTPAAAPNAFSFAASGQTTTTPSFGFNSNNANTGTPSLFTSTGSTAFTGFQQQPQQQQQFFPSPVQQQQYFPGYVPFATTPYKDNPLFYNMISNRKLEEMTRPTSPLAIHQYMESLRKTRSPAGYGFSGLSWKRGSPSVAPPRRNSSVSICKFAIWEGFDDGEKEGSSSVNVLAPKNRDWKRLVLNSAPTTPVNCASCSKTPPARKISPLSRSLNLSNSSPSRWLKSGGLLKQRTRLNLNALSSELEVEENGGGGGAGGDVSSFSSLKADLSDSLESRRLSSTPRFRIGAILEEDEEKPRGAADSGGAGDCRASTAEDKGENASSSEEITKGCGVICTRAGYYIKPSLEEMDKMVDNNGRCFVRGLEVGRRNFGRIKFLQVVDVMGINIDEIVFFRHKEVVVYPDDDEKPPLYEGLNVPAEIELERVWPIDKGTNEAIRCLKKIEEMKYEEKLRKACVRLGAEFLAYNEEECVWKFQVPHF